MTWVIRTIDAEDTQRVAEILARLIKAPEVIELRADLGGGKTTFVKGLVRGLGIDAQAGSPTFTLNKVYKSDEVEVHHFDFYRLHEAGVLAEQLQESIDNPRVVTVVEWGDLVKNVLPDKRITIEFKPVADNPDERVVTFNVPQSKMEIIERLRNTLAETKP